MSKDAIVSGHVFQELLARLVVLLHDPLAREQLATQILAVRMSYLSPRWLMNECS